VAALWLAGCLAWWAVAGRRLWRFGRLLRHARPAPGPVQGRATRLAGRLGLARCPGVWFLPAPVSPMLLALGRSPRLLLPAGLWERLSAEQQDTLLLHELAHLRRGDHRVRRLELVVLGLYWWHPVVWWAQRALQEAEEQCCDAWVVWAAPAAAPAYAAALVEAVAFLSPSRSALPVGASGTGQVPLLKRRLTMILRGTPPRSLSRAGFWAVLGLGAVLLPLVPAVAQPQPPARPAKRPVEDPHHPTWPAHGPFLKEQACQKCHITPVAHAADAGKPASWKSAHDEAVRLMDEVKVKEAQLRQAQERLERALARMDDLTRRAEQPPAPKRGAVKQPPDPQAPRLTDLEKKMDILLKEMSTLRRELRQPPTRPAPKKESRGGYYSRQRAFMIPVQIGPGANVKEVLLYVSEDEGTTYQLAARGAPADKAFRFSAPRDGCYWFTIQTQGQDGRLYPPDLKRGELSLKVCVDTSPPVVTLEAVQRRDGDVVVHWDVRDDNLDLPTLRLEYRPAGETEWNPLSVHRSAVSEYVWKAPAVTDLELRLRVSDKAGNSTSRTVRVTRPH
jgi:beta-lactamase regulating signal transducer with metallopeptidase domain